MAAENVGAIGVATIQVIRVTAIGIAAVGAVAIHVARTHTTSIRAPVLAVAREGASMPPIVQASGARIPAARICCFKRARKDRNGDGGGGRQKPTVALHVAFPLLPAHPTPKGKGLSFRAIEAAKPIYPATFRSDVIQC
jgi:hypothetical protein